MIINQSLNHSPSLFDAPGTEALTFRNNDEDCNQCCKIFLRCKETDSYNAPWSVNCRTKMF